ncbi:methylated-DNA--protein-cysteine methyltransferase, constitutive [bacterium BMS3Bbin03]|nr:methylated-DNA--protein-cysteine methyltransferase, constitutive [bacterium BMS3Bbin03]
MIYYGLYPLKWLGWICIASTDKGLCLISLRSQSPPPSLFQLASRMNASLEENSEKNKNAFRQLKAYWDVTRQDFDLPIDWSTIPSAFERRVLQMLQTVPYGITVSYQELAEMAGAPKAFRAVGNTMRKNPMPIVIPCHRVIRKNSALGGYTGGLDIKRKLLAIEGIL